MSDPRAFATARLFLFDPGQGDPVVSDYGFMWLDQLAGQDEAPGRPDFDAAGLPLVEFIKGIGVCCAAFPVPKNTSLSQFTPSGGNWDTLIPGTGAPRVQFIEQYSTTAGVQWSATSTYSLPSEPDFVASFLIEDTPADWNATTFPPYVRLEWGGSAGRYGLHFQNGKLHLMRRLAGTWQSVKELKGSPKKSGQGNKESESSVYVRCLRGRLCISTDFGKSYEIYQDPAGDLSIPPGTLTFRGQGGWAAFNLSQLQYFTGKYTSQPRGTAKNRLSPTVTLAPWASTPGTSSVTLADLGSGSTAQYRATLTPANVGALVPFQFQRCPVLMAVTYDIGVTTDPLTGGGTTTQPWNHVLESISPEKPFELDGGSVSFQFKSDAFSLFTGNYRDRKLGVQLGHVREDGTAEYFDAGVYYIEEVSLSREEWGRVPVTMRARSATAPYQDHKWNSLETRALGGMTANAAADYVLSRLGRGSAYRSWHALGDSFVLDRGTPENPAFLLKKGSSAWDTLQEIFGAAGLEIGVTNSGLLATVPRHYVAPVVWIKYGADGAGLELRDRVATLSNRLNYSQNSTAVLVEGKGEGEELLLCYNVDGAAETQVTSGRFAPWRKLYTEEMQGALSGGTLQSRAAALMLELTPLKTEPELSVPVDIRMARRDQVTLYGCESVGIPEGAHFVILTIRHEYRAETALSELRTFVGLRRIS